jgi:hypothetical protein
MRRLPYVYEQALCFLGVLAIFGALFGALYAAAKGWLR